MCSYCARYKSSVLLLNWNLFLMEHRIRRLWNYPNSNSKPDLMIGNQITLTTLPRVLSRPWRLGTTPSSFQPVYFLDLTYSKSISRSCHGCMVYPCFRSFNVF